MEVYDLNCSQLYQQHLAVLEPIEDKINAAISIHLSL